MEETVLLGHGSGGTMMKRIIDEIFFEAYAGSDLLKGDDAATLAPFCELGSCEAEIACGSDVDTMSAARFASAGESGDGASTTTGVASASECGAGASSASEAPEPSACENAKPGPNGFSSFSTDGRLAFSTDSFVVSPHFFPGGDIGRLAICGTVNDVATSGARPLYLSCGFILEEGYPIADLKRICQSMAEAAREAGVSIVTGDTKVVNRGHGDGVFINTSGVGVLPKGLNLSGSNCRPGDKVIVSGTLGDHGITIMSCRESLSFSTDVQSDAAPLNHLISGVLWKTGAFNCGVNSTEISPVRCFRDPTRGGLASTLNELASQSNVDIEIADELIPVRDSVRGACDMLGYDVLQVANEGKMVCIVSPDQAEAALAAMRDDPYGKDAAIIGEVAEARPDRGPKVYVRNAFGGRRILDMLVGEQLPRIC